MTPIKKVYRFLAALALAPLLQLEAKERERRLVEKLERLERRQTSLSSDHA